MINEGATVHNAILQQKKMDEEIDSLDQLRKLRLRTILRNALIYRATRITDHEGHLTPRFEKRLDALVAFSLTCDIIKPYNKTVFRMRFEQGISEDEIALIFGKKRRAVFYTISNTLDTIVAHANPALLSGLIKHCQWIIDGCRNCTGGDLYWDDDAASVGEYACFQCGRRYNYWGNGLLIPVTQSKIAQIAQRA